MDDLERVFEPEYIAKLTVENASYIRSYPHMLEYFHDIPQLTAKDVVVGAHMVYGWMPTIVHLNKNGAKLEDVIPILQSAKDGDVALNTNELEVVKKCVNNSIVGASKLLHFINPEQYPIWDSKIFRFAYPATEPHPNRVNNVKTYTVYRERLLKLMHHPRFLELHSHINQELGYSVSGLRAFELAMFVGGTK